LIAAMHRLPLRLAAVAALAAISLLVARRAVAQGAAVRSVAHPAWTRHAVIYEVNIRQHTPEGTIAAFRRELPKLRDLGVDVLWIMPVQPISRKDRKGSLGSYYAIADYDAVNPEFGDMADMRGLVADAHRMGMRVILDWVANHTGRDHPWIAAHPDWYVRRTDGSVSTPIDKDGKETDWTDVAQLDYRSPAMRAAMLASMRRWLDEVKVDGFRCDVAYLVPADFWATARRTLGAGRPDFFMLAEAEEPAMHQSFDMTYWWSLHHLVNAIAQGKRPAAALDTLLARDAREYPADAYRMAFTSSHDENSWNGSEFERMGESHRAGFVLMATLRNTFPMLYSGQEGGNRKRIRFFDKDTVEVTDTALASFYRRVIALKHASPALANGAAGGAQATLALDGAPASAYAFTRTRGRDAVLVAVNMGGAAQSLRYAALAQPGRWRDWFTGAPVTLGRSGALDLPAHGVRVLVRGRAVPPRR
jgi:glycosidase